MFNILIKNAEIIEGNSSKSFVGDVAIAGDKIAAIDKKIEANAETVIDAHGKILTPGFIDLQNHSDGYWQLFDNPSLDSLISQGFTTVVIGNCGASLAPLINKDALQAIQKWHSLEGVNTNWQSYSEFLEELAKRRFGCNIASLVGYSTLRRGIIGDEIRSLEKEETAALAKILRESLEAGAFGMSTGLAYSHEVIISEIELYELAKILAKADALFSVHLRNEASEVLESVEEALDIARSAEVNLKISHLKIRYEENWNKAENLLSLLETAFHKGINAHFDVYPYTSVWQPLYAYLPKWAIEGGRKVLLKHLNDPVQKNKILTYLNSGPWRFSQMQIASTANKLNLTGKLLGQVAKNLETSSEQAVLHLIQNGGSEVLVFEESLNQKLVEEFCFHPLSMIGTDGGGFNLTVKDKLVHPRCFGTSAKFIKKALLKNDYSLPDAIAKLTSIPAKKIGLKKRGEIKAGNFADVVIFDKDKMADKSTYQNPYQFSEGFEYVFINGKVAVSEGKITRNLSGYVLRKS